MADREKKRGRGMQALNLHNAAASLEDTTPLAAASGHLTLIKLNSNRQ